MNTQRTCLSCKSKEYSLRALVDQSLSLFLPPSAAYATQYASFLAYNPPLLCDSNHVTVLPPYAAQSVYSPVGTVESHPISKLKRDASEHQMIDSNSRPEGQIRKENRVGSAKAREMPPSESRLAEGLSDQPVTGVPLSLCRIGNMCPSEAGMPPTRATPRYKGRAATYKQGMRDKRPLGSFEVALDALQRGTGKVVNHFTYFDSHESFFAETACTAQRNFYEIISDGNPCVCTLTWNTTLQETCSHSQCISTPIISCGHTLDFETIMEFHIPLKCGKHAYEDVQTSN